MGDQCVPTAIPGASTLSPNNIRRIQGISMTAYSPLLAKAFPELAGRSLALGQGFDSPRIQVPDYQVLVVLAIRN
jgi:hypothetical protein